jgi:hypothetical protein
MKIGSLCLVGRDVRRFVKTLLRKPSNKEDDFQNKITI